MENIDEGKIIDGIKNLFGLGSKPVSQQNQQTQQVNQQSALEKEFEDKKSYWKSLPGINRRTQSPLQNSTEQRLGLSQPQANQTTALSLSSSERHKVNKAFDKIDFIAEKVPQADGTMAQAYKTIADYINTIADQILNNLGLRYAESAYKKLNKLRESYKDFEWQYIRYYFTRLEDVDFSGYNNDQLYDYLCDYFEKLNIELRQAQEDWSPWKDSYVFSGETVNSGYIVIYVDFENIYDALRGTAYKKECVTSLATTAIHELMHRYQCTQYSDRKWDKIKTEEDYLGHKDEISAHIVGGISELLNIGYTKEDLKKALTSMDSDLENNKGPFWESNSLYIYWNNFGSFDTKDPVWIRFKKELAERILEIDNEE